MSGFLQQPVVNGVCGSESPKAYDGWYSACERSVIESADNHAGLIALYKSRLVDGNEEEQRKARLALGQVYLDTNDRIYSVYD